MESDGGDSDWDKEVEEFEKTKAGVKGLVDSGIAKVPIFFINPLPELTHGQNGVLKADIPVIDLQGINDQSRRTEIVNEIRRASETWGFFQMINHGVPISVTDAILDSTKRLHEQPKEDKVELYSSDSRKSVRFYTINGHLTKPDAASWRDAFSIAFVNDVVDPEVIPAVCRNEITEYVKHMISLRDVLSKLLSESLGLSRDFLQKMECMKSEYLSCLYYPSCPEPHKTFGTPRHSDPTLITVLVQDDTGGLQIRHDNTWVDVPPVQGALIANIGDLFQFMSNDKFKSVEHRVLARSNGTRLSTACFFYPSRDQMTKLYGPIKELLSEENPPIYKEVSYLEFITHYQKKVIHKDGYSALSKFKLQP